MVGHCKRLDMCAVLYCMSISYLAMFPMASYTLYLASVSAIQTVLRPIHRYRVPKLELVNVGTES